MQGVRFQWRCRVKREINIKAGILHPHQGNVPNWSEESRGRSATRDEADKTHALSCSSSFSLNSIDGTSIICTVWKTHGKLHGQGPYAQGISVI